MTEIETRSGLELIGKLPVGERVLSMVTVGLTNDIILACTHGVFVWNILGRRFDPAPGLGEKVT